MNILTNILIACFAGFLLYGLYRFIQGNPESLSKESLNKSFSTMGLLALALIGFIALVVMLLRQT